jgi:hypothetical protein
MLTLLWACTGTISTTDDSSKESIVVDDSEPSNNVKLPDLVINELLAANVATNADEAGEFDDWVELYNAGNKLIQFEGLYMTDNMDNPTQWALPAGKGLGPGEYVLIWCDNAPEQGDYHASFQLNKDGDDLAIYFVDGGKDPVRVDGVEWVQEQADIAAARVPDGSTTWKHQAPTPGESNGNGE